MTTFDEKEVEKFSKIADEWWDEAGKFKPLHKFNPSRISYINQKIRQHFKIEKDLSSLKIIDIGCGGGLICEPFARLKANMTGIDASQKNIKVAQIHAQKSGLDIKYQQSLVEDLPLNEKYDVVFALEIIEHIADVDEFIKNCARLLDKNGLLFIATINRTMKSLLMAKIGVEYILRWLPIGTHSWKKFLKPREIFEKAEKFDLKLEELRGFVYRPLKDDFVLSQKDFDVNYIMVFSRS